MCCLRFWGSGCVCIGAHAARFSLVLTAPSQLWLQLARHTIDAEKTFSIWQERKHKQFISEKRNFNKFGQNFGAIWVGTYGTQPVIDSQIDFSTLCKNANVQTKTKARPAQTASEARGRVIMRMARSELLAPAPCAAEHAFLPSSCDSLCTHRRGRCEKL